jgi:hypothetical protein
MNDNSLIRSKPNMMRANNGQIVRKSPVGAGTAMNISNVNQTKISYTGGMEKSFNAGNVSSVNIK